MASSYIAPDAAAACEACQAESLCGQTQACARDIDCVQITSCGAACVTQDCVFGCINERDASTLSAYIFASGPCRTACAYGNDWECSNNVDAPFATAGESVVTFTAASSADERPYIGATVKGCLLSDTACTKPVALGTTESTGTVTLTLPGSNATLGFDGYLDVTAPGMYPYLIFFLYPLSEPTVTFSTYYLAPPTEIASIYDAASVTADPARGAIVAVSMDCHWLPAPGAQVAAVGTDGLSKLVYPTADSYSGNASATDDSGKAMFLNVPAGAVTLSATPLAVGRVTSTKQIFVRPGTLSLLFMRPNVHFAANDP